PPGLGERALDELAGHAMTDDDEEADAFERVAQLCGHRAQRARPARQVGPEVDHGNDVSHHVPPGCSRAPNVSEGAAGRRLAESCPIRHSYEVWDGRR